MGASLCRPRSRRIRGKIASGKAVEQSLALWNHKKGADTGIDGYINFFDDKSGQAKQVIVQVKSGYVGVSHVRDLKGVIEREKAVIGALITLREPTFCSAAL